jgi:hypothetical protein
MVCHQQVVGANDSRWSNYRWSLEQLVASDFPWLKFSWNQNFIYFKGCIKKNYQETCWNFKTNYLNASFAFWAILNMSGWQVNHVLDFEFVKFICAAKCGKSDVKKGRKMWPCHWWCKLLWARPAPKSTVWKKGSDYHFSLRGCSCGHLQ